MAKPSALASTLASLSPTAQAAIGSAPFARPIETVALHELPSRIDAYRGKKPLALQIDRDTWATDFAGLRALSSPEGLHAAPYASGEVALLGGQDAAGNKLINTRRSVADLVRPAVDGFAGFAPDAFHYFQMFINNERQPGPFKFPPSEPWHAAFMPQVPESLPLHLLDQPDTQGNLETPDVNVAGVWGIGPKPPAISSGAFWHKHGANLFIQLHGMRKWSIVDKDFDYFVEKFTWNGPIFRPEFHRLCSDPRWDTAVDTNGKVAYECITEPGTILYVPAYRCLGAESPVL
jgi:hypothetical protein